MCKLGFFKIVVQMIPYNKHFFFYLIFTVLSALSMGQSTEKINLVDENNKKQGTWISYHSNGNIRYKGKFKDDQPMDTMTRYYENGMKRSVMIYDENGRDVYAYIYHTNGFLASEGNYRDQMKEGKWKFFSSTIDGYMVTEEHYTENIRNGKSIKYFENGNIADITIYSFGIKEDKWLQYYSNGVPFLEANYSNGKLDGKFETWFNNGNPKSVGLYKDNLREGKWLIYNEDGSLKYEANYVRGTPDNKQMIIDGSELIDKMELDGRYVDDPENGLPMFY